MRASIRSPGLFLSLILVLALAPVASAQVARGNIYGKAVDVSGGLLPGVTVTLSGEFGTRTTTTTEAGEFRFLNVDQGRHIITLDIPASRPCGGKSPCSPPERGPHLELQVATVEETVTVTAETPWSTPRRSARPRSSRTTSSARSPARVTPGPPAHRPRRDRRPREHRRQQAASSRLHAKGADQKDSVWSIDGVVITDMAALGSSPGYYSTTRSARSTSRQVAQRGHRHGGLGINMVTKRGTSQFRGGVGGFFTHDDLSGATSRRAGRRPRLKGSDKADHTQQIADWSAELGGPIVKDKLWFYGSYGSNDIRVINLNQQMDKSVLTNWSAKLNWQAGPNDMVSAFWFLSEKEKIGRLGAAGSLTHLEGTR
jgi:hypothetical protein